MSHVSVYLCVGEVIMSPLEHTGVGAPKGRQKRGLKNPSDLLNSHDQKTDHDEWW